MDRSPLASRKLHRCNFAIRQIKLGPATDFREAPTAKPVTSKSFLGRWAQANAVEWVDCETQVVFPLILAGEPVDGHLPAGQPRVRDRQPCQARSEAGKQKPKPLPERWSDQLLASLQAVQPEAHRPSFPMVDWRKGARRANRT
jgi:hypothetical protein